MTGAQAMSTPTPGRPRRSSKMPRMGAANVTMKLAHQTVAAPASPCMPSGPPPKMKPERATSSTASARSATTAMAYIIFMRHECHVTDHTLPRLGGARAPQARHILLGLGPSLALEARAYRRRSCVP